MLPGGEWPSDGGPPGNRKGDVSSQWISRDAPSMYRSADPPVDFPPPPGRRHGCAGLKNSAELPYP